jgi:pimeloyl-ACP methyl ester carboxylesterase
LLKCFRQVELNIPTLYVMGEEDYMFLPSVRKVVEKHVNSAQLFVVSACGHVVNVEQPKLFNTNVIAFIHNQS